MQVDVGRDERSNYKNSFTSLYPIILPFDASHEQLGVRALSRPQKTLTLLGSMNADLALEA